MRAIDCLVGALAAGGPGGGGGCGLGIWDIRLVGGTLSFKAYIAKFGLFWACKMGIGLSILSLNFFWI